VRAHTIRVHACTQYARMCVYVCMYVCMCMCICNVCACMCASAHACARVRAVYSCACMCVRARVRERACMPVWMCVCVHARARTHARADDHNKRACAHAQTQCAFACTQARVYACARAGVCACTRPCGCGCVRAHANTPAHADVRVWEHVRVMRRTRARARQLRVGARGRQRRKTKAHESETRLGEQRTRSPERAPKENTNNAKHSTQYNRSIINTTRASAPRTCRRKASKRGRGAAQPSQLGERGERFGHRPADRVDFQVSAKTRCRPGRRRQRRYTQTRWVQYVQCVGTYMRDEGMCTNTPKTYEEKTL
jgi:hypothetical protein